MRVELQQLANLLKTRIKNVLSRGIIRSVKNDKTATAQIDLLHGETNQGLEFPQQFGFISKPLDQAECIAAFFGGNRDHGTILAAFDKRYAPIDLEDGETCLYNKVTNTRVWLKQDGKILIISDKEIKAQVLNSTATIQEDGKVVVEASNDVDVTSQGNINLTANEQINLNTTGSEVNINTETTNVSGDKNIEGDLDVGGTGSFGDDVSTEGVFQGDLFGNVTGNLTGSVNGNVTGNVSGNAGTVTNGVYTTGAYSDPSWLLSLSVDKITGVEYGSYNPTLTNLTNVAGSTVVRCNYYRIGNLYHVEGLLIIDPTGAGATTIDISLPTPFNVETDNQVAGLGCAATATETWTIIGEVTANRARMEGLAVDTAAHRVHFSFTYRTSAS